MQDYVQNLYQTKLNAIEIITTPTICINNYLASQNDQPLSTTIEHGLINSNCEYATNYNFSGQIDYAGKERIFVGRHSFSHDKYSCLLLEGDLNGNEFVNFQKFDTTAPNSYG